MNDNIATVVFREDECSSRASGTWQYDYGQILRIQGLDLPKVVEIHFSLEETGGTSVTRIGTTKDSVTDVPIPDSMLENEESDQNYNVYAFVFLTTRNSGSTECRIRIKNGEVFEDIAADYPALTTDDLGAIRKALNLE